MKKHECEVKKTTLIDVYEREKKPALLRLYDDRINGVEDIDVEIAYCPYCGEDVDDRNTGEKSPAPDYSHDPEEIYFYK